MHTNCIEQYKHAILNFVTNNLRFIRRNNIQTNTVF